jgi:proteasome activator subunit 4
LAWKSTLDLFEPPDQSKSTFQPWERDSDAVVESIRNTVLDESFWKSLSKYYSEENHEVYITQDNASCVKSICKPRLDIIQCVPCHSSICVVQLLEDAPFEALRPTLEELIGCKEQDKQRAAAELLAGLFGGNLIDSSSSQRLNPLCRLEALASECSDPPLEMVCSVDLCHFQAKDQDRYRLDLGILH